MNLKALEGQEWSSRLVYIHYEGKEVSSSTKYEQRFLPDGLARPPVAKDAIDGKIIKLTAFAADLKFSGVTNIFKKLISIDLNLPISTSLFYSS